MSTMASRSDSWLRALGWIVREAAVRGPDGLVFWQVHCARDAQNVIARAPRQGQAWEAACRMVGRVHVDEGAI